MSTPIIYDYVKLHSCGPTDKVFKRAPFKRVSDDIFVKNN